MHNFNSVAPNVRGYVEFKHKGTWKVAIGHRVTLEPTIFNDKNDAMMEVLESIKVGKVLAEIGNALGVPAPQMPTVDDFRYVPVEVPAALDKEPADMQAASDVLKAAADKAKGGAA